MKFEDLQTFTRLIPGNKASVFSNGINNKLINEGADEVNTLAKILKKQTDFTITENKGIYSITSDITTDFLTMDDSGFWWNNGTTWREVYPKTRKWLDENITNWRDRATGDPRWYFMNGDDLNVVNTPNTTLAGGGRIYYIRKGTDMSDAGHYPFHPENDQDTEITQYKIFAQAIILYVRWKVTMNQSKQDANAQAAAKLAFKEEVAEKSALITRMANISKHRDRKMHTRTRLR